MPDHELEPYERQAGEIPALVGLENERRQATFNVLHQLALLKLVMEHHGGRVVITGLGDNAVIEQLLKRYELAIKGTGSGGFEMWVIDKQAET